LVISSLHGFVFGVAEGFEVALDAFGAASLTDLAAMPDELMGEENPAFLGDDAHQVLLDLLWFGMVSKVEAPGETLYMGVDDDARSDPEGGAEDDVSGLASHARER
jgi:hypothetical protein